MGNAKISKKRVGIYDPYLDILGGGERFILTMAEYYSVSNIVDVFWSDDLIKDKAYERLRINLKRINFLPTEDNIFRRFMALRKYNLFIYVTDGSLFRSSAGQGVLIIQSPQHVPNISSLPTKWKLASWKKIICYSEFVAKIAQKKLQRDILVVPPPIDVESFIPGKKENIILCTGRFFSHLHSKKQDFLVDWFKDMSKEKILHNWKLVLIGSVENHPDAMEFLEKIKNQAKEYAIEIITNASFTTLKNFYAKAKIFWLATGYGEDLNRFPEKAEHFGMVTLEAMSAQVVPVVFAAGGQMEIVEHGHTGFLFKTKEELKTYTLKLASDDIWREKMAASGRQISKKFAKANFYKKLNEHVSV